MGLGKTVQACALLWAYRDEWPALIVAPSSLRWVARPANPAPANAYDSTAACAASLLAGCKHKRVPSSR
jgi:hypothetical protein